jgi:hypothetical protein
MSLNLQKPSRSSSFMQASLKIAWNLGHGIPMSIVSTVDVHYNSDIFVRVVLWLVAKGTT